MRKQFTLIELLVVIAIIAILAAILLPALQSARERGVSASCISQLKQCGTAAASYNNDNRGFFPGVNTNGNAKKGEKTYPTWAQVYADTKYLGTRLADGSTDEATRCPKTGRGKTNGIALGYIRSATYAAPYQNNTANSVNKGYGPAIWLNATYWRTNYHTVQTSQTIADGNPKQDVTLSDLILFVDGMSKTMHASSGLYAHRKGDESDDKAVPFMTHSGRANMCMWDFSVRSVSGDSLGSDIFLVYASQYMSTSPKAYIIEGENVVNGKYKYFNTDSVR
ncbi:MAG: prepilin-type N-terminal cleavage/methylation domain-containing protein [Lentisphaeria bacterium]|nr:prepilin-type N-terminal cleavage/methylation domain-containing protein [Lentisphaeria bacterium]